MAVASPAYLEQIPAPETPQDLVGHNCVNHHRPRSGGLYAWEFENDGLEHRSEKCEAVFGKSDAVALRVRVDGQLKFTTTMAMIGATVSGLGIAYVPEDLVVGHIEAGRLAQVLDDWSPMFLGLIQLPLPLPRRREERPPRSPRF